MTDSAKKSWKKKSYTPLSKEDAAALVEEETRQRADLFIEGLKNGTAGIGREHPWDLNLAIKRLPYNAKTGLTYRGGNSKILELQHSKMIKDGLLLPTDNDPRWMTYDQAQKAGCQVVKGAKSVKIYTVGTVKNSDKDEEKKEKTSNTTLPVEGTLVAVDKSKQAKYMVPARVFHASQISGLPPLPPEPVLDVDEKLRAAQEIVDKSGALIVYGHARAAYSPSTDVIMMPPSAAFSNPAREMAVKLHELAHWTGAKDRLNRPQVGMREDKEAYSREELVAEMASYAMAQRLGFGGLYDPSHHTGYVSAWVKVLEDQPAELTKASQQASKVLDYLNVPLPKYEPMPDVIKPEPQKTIPRGPGAEQINPGSTKKPKSIKTTGPGLVI